jgi:hypothetical protein
MSVGFSVYHALHPYTGQIGVRQSAAELAALTTFTLDALREWGVRRLSARLLTPTSLSGLTGRLFVNEFTDAPARWQPHRLTRDDVLCDDHFIVADDDNLPIILVARRVEGAFMTLMSIDEPLIESARVILAQYHEDPYLPITFTPINGQTAGYFAARVAHRFTPTLISSWITPALHVKDVERLRALQQASGSLSMRLNHLMAGRVPRGVTGQIRVEKIAVSEGEFEAVGYADDPEFTLRAHIAAGILSAESPAPPVSPSNNASKAPSTTETATVRAVNLDIGLESLEALERLFKTDMAAALSNTPPPTISAPTPPTVPAPPRDPIPPLAIAAELPPPVVDVPGASLGVLQYVSREMGFLRDAIMDIGLTPTLPRQPRKKLDEFVSRSGDLLLLIDDVMAMQHIVEHVRADAEALDPHALLGSLVMTYAGEAERRGVELSYDAPDDLPRAWGSPAAINRALVTILEAGINAAAPRGTVQIGARAESGGERPMLALFVQDSGAPHTDAEIAARFQASFHDPNGDLRDKLNFIALKAIAEAHYGSVFMGRSNNANISILRLPLNEEKDVL